MSLHLCRRLLLTHGALLVPVAAHLQEHQFTVPQPLTLISMRIDFIVLTSLMHLHAQHGITTCTHARTCKTHRHQNPGMAGCRWHATGTHTNLQSPKRRPPIAPRRKARSPSAHGLARTKAEAQARATVALETRTP